MAGVETVVELAVDKLYDAVADASRKVLAFKSQLKNIISTFDDLKQNLGEIKELNEMNYMQHRSATNKLISLLKDGEALILKCSEIKRLQLYKKYQYARKLEEWDQSLLRCIQCLVPIENLIENKIIRSTISSSHGTGTPNNSFAGWCDVPEVTESIMGFESPLQELKKMLLKDDDDNVLVVSALGGCGKTTLVKLVCCCDEIKTMYTKICFVTVSRTADLSDIVRTILNMLNNGNVPNFRSDEDAINQLCNLLQGTLKSHSMLLVLDDVWQESVSVLRKLSFHLPKYKVLVTTRCDFAAYKNTTYKLQFLPHDVAKNLFDSIAFKYEKCNLRRDLVDKVVKSCGGIPLALKVVAGYLQNERDLTWMNRIGKQSKSQILFSSDSDLLDCLQPSIDVLESKSKDCYLDLGLFLEDQRIPVTVLLDIWAELYDLDELDASGILFDLAGRYLIDLAYRRKDGPYNIGVSNLVHYVKQHDVLRELAIHQSANEAIENRKRLNIGNDFISKQTSLLLQAQMLSISTDEGFFCNGYNFQVPNLEVLLLNFQTSSYTLPKFVEEANRRKVLVLTNNGLSIVKFSNFSLLEHLHNLKRIRLERISFSSIYQSTFKLVNLQKLSLAMCEIGGAFQDCDGQMPNLAEINIEYCDDMVELPTGICDLINLKTLSISYCEQLADIPKELGKLENLQVLRLHSCSNLKDLPDSIGGLSKLRFLDIYDCVDLDSIPPQIGELRSLETIFMGGRQGVDELPNTIPKLVGLKDVVCDEETASLWEGYKLCFKNLLIRIVKDDMNLDWLHKSSCLENL